MRNLLLLLALLITLSATTAFATTSPLRRRMSFNFNLNNNNNNINKNYQLKLSHSEMLGIGRRQLDLPFGTPGTANCSERFFEQDLDHNNYNPKTRQTFQQRYYICGLKGTDVWRSNQTIFFYTGNECDVELFVNQTGLMWESRKQFGNALLVFAELRYFGKSLPFPSEPLPKGDKLKYLTVEQALEDYAILVEHIKTVYDSRASKVISFGGSFGGMLSAYFRLKYPHVVTGAIAASAPVANFEHMTPVKYDYNSFAAVEAFDASVAGGASQYCSASFEKTWQVMNSKGMTAAGRAELTSIFKTCQPLNTSDDATAIVNYLYGQLYYLAMGSYSWSSGYMLLGGAGKLPPYPMRVACNFFTQDPSTISDNELLQAAMQAFLVYNNASGSAGFTCLNPNKQVNQASEITDYLWGYLACTSMVMPMSTDKVSMVPPSVWNETANSQYCMQTYGVEPNTYWARDVMGGSAIATTTTNIVFSNGQLDPWRPGGIQSIPMGPNGKALTNNVAIIIAEYGHHSDLFFSHPNDSDKLIAARNAERQIIKTWLA